MLGPLLGRVLRTVVINPARFTRPADVAAMADAVTSFDEQRARRLAERFVQDGTWNVPTLVRELSTFRCDTTDLADAEELRYVGPRVLASWRRAARRFATFPEQTRQAFSSAYDLLGRLTALFDGVGARMLAGSDVCGAVWLVPGVSLHREFDELARAGLPALRVLQMATSEAADFLGATEDFGAVAAGRAADLVLLGADPRESVTALHDLRGVVRAGHYHDDAALAAIRDRVAANRSAG